MASPLSAAGALLSPRALAPAMTLPLPLPAAYGVHHVGTASLPTSPVAAKFAASTSAPLPLPDDLMVDDIMAEAEAEFQYEYAASSSSSSSSSASSANIKVDVTPSMYDTAGSEHDLDASVLVSALQSTTLGALAPHVASRNTPLPSPNVSLLARRRTAQPATTTSYLRPSSAADDRMVCDDDDDDDDMTMVEDDDADAMVTDMPRPRRVPSPTLSRSSRMLPPVPMLPARHVPAAEADPVRDLFATLPYLPAPAFDHRPVPSDVPLLLPHLHVAPAPAEAAALTRVAELLLFGVRGTALIADEPRAFKLLTAAADHGCVKARGLLGFCYEFGLGVTASFKNAEPHYQVAANAGHAVSMARLAFLRRYGRPHVRMNRGESELWQQRVARLGDPDMPRLACNATAALDPNPRHGDPLAWLWWAAETCMNAAAQYALGTCFHDGVGVEKSATTAVQWYRLSADQENPRGQGILGYCYGEAFGVEKDANLALKYYLLAANQGETVAMYNVGYVYEESIGVERNMEIAFQWYQRAAELGNALAANSLGYFYEEGFGCDKNIDQAVYWYRVAAEQGNPWAEHNLAYMYASGTGVPQDDRLAYMWFRRSAEQGHAGAQNRVAQFLQQGTGCDADPIEAVVWFEKAAAQNYSTACIALAWCYEHGHGVKPDVHVALDWVKRALDLGYQDTTVSDWAIALGLRVSMVAVGELARATMADRMAAEAA
ncbi:hypothetical protein AMAG_06418 [Allomyces macrogynus ATCC 38327]|uniref:HCP-like protein n=1 Tax=Allomyces macrogynus (strain ATCC 38327) TaxID=578462 RepID=A0A0L0SGW7_ALLM3|nr:hypothetical protein AMAG_06418 [Allomyces macrogynus ATCC 38327]|eukprot:KNE61605.1 hypothetical protein AMAG_06418 [Allomyces macrogynus ATCC 38327]